MRTRLILALALISPIAFADVQIKSGADTNTLTVDANKNARTALGSSTRPTHIATASALTAATAHTLSIEASAGTGFKLISWCVGLSNATAAVAITVTVQRRTTASSGGTLLTVEGTGANSIAKMNPSDANFGGVGRLDGTPGSAGAMLDQENIQIGIIATGAGSQLPFCHVYAEWGEEPPTVAAGVANGLSIAVPTLGAGSLATSIRAVVIYE